MRTRRVFHPPYALLVTRVSPNQSNAAPLIGARAKNLQAASARHRSPGAARRRRQRQAHIPLPTSTSSPTRSTPGLSAQFLRTHHRRVRRGSSSYAAGFSGIRCTSLASAATYAFVAAAAGQRDDGARCRSDRRFDGFDISCSVADAAAAPSFASARRREAADRAQTATTALLDLRSVFDRTLFFAARPFRPSKNVYLAPRVPMSTFSKPSSQASNTLYPSAGRRSGRRIHSVLFPSFFGSRKLVFRPWIAFSTGLYILFVSWRTRPFLKVGGGRPRRWRLLARRRTAF